MRLQNNLSVMLITFSFLICSTTIISGEAGTTFTYQGRLLEDNAAASGMYDMEFTLYDDPNTVIAMQVGSKVVVENVEVVDGYFIAELDFGSEPFGSDALWLEIGVCPAGLTTFEYLSPLQPITPSPMAIYSQTSSNSETLDGMDASAFSPSGHSHVLSDMSGAVTDSQVPDTITVDYSATAGNASALNGYVYKDFFLIVEDVSVRGIPSFIGGTSGSEPPFEVDSNFLVNNLNADLLDGLHASSFLSTGNDYGRQGVASVLYEGTEPLSDKYVSKTGDVIVGNFIDQTLKVQNTSSGSGILGVSQAPNRGGILGMNTGWSGWGVWGKTTGRDGIGVHGEAWGTDGIGVDAKSTASAGKGVSSEAAGASGTAVYGTASDTTSSSYNYGGYFEAGGGYGRGVTGFGTNTGDEAYNYGGYFVAAGHYGEGVYAESTGSEGVALHAKVTGTGATAALMEGDVKISGYNKGIVFDDDSKMTTAPTGIPSGYCILGHSTSAPSGFTHIDTLVTGGRYRSRNSMDYERGGIFTAALDGYIYAIGGGGNKDKNERYNPVTNSWTDRASLMTPRTAGGNAAVVDGYLYVIGGWSDDYSEKNERYDPATDSWASMTPIPTARTQHATVAVEGKIYLIGGHDDNGYVSRTEVYVPVFDAWATVASLPIAMQNANVAAVGEKIYVLGGHLDGNVTTSASYVYDTTTNTWSPLPSKPTACYSANVAVLGGKIYCIGGGTGTNNVIANEVFDTTSNSWSSEQEYPNGQENPGGAAALNGKIYLMGGYSFDQSDWIAKVTEYTPQNSYEIFQAD